MMFLKNKNFCFLVFILSTCPLLVLGCLGHDIEERFSRYKVAKEYSFASCRLNDKDSGELLFEFSMDELEKLEREIGSMGIFDPNEQTWKEVAYFPLCDGIFKFEDGFEITIDCGVGRAGTPKQWLLDFSVPDEIGGVIGSRVRLKNVLTDERIIEFSNAMEQLAD
jgi:hypothetical protein